MKKYYFTFGQIHIHRINGKTFDADCVVEIVADSYGSAREKIVENFGEKWAFQYREIPNMEYFPRGIITL